MIHFAVAGIAIGDSVTLASMARVADVLLGLIRRKQLRLIGGDFNIFFGDILTKLRMQDVQVNPFAWLPCGCGENISVARHYILGVGPVQA